jgi:hypothetical protein
MVAPVTVRERDLRALAGMVSEDRSDLPDGEGLPPSLLADLMDQIRCDGISLDRYDSGRRACSLLQLVPAPSDDEPRAFEDLDPARLERFWACHWDCQSCSYPERTGDLRVVVKPSDFISPKTPRFRSSHLMPSRQDRRLQQLIQCAGNGFVAVIRRSADTHPPRPAGVMPRRPLANETCGPRPGSSATAGPTSAPTGSVVTARFTANQQQARIPWSWRCRSCT